MIVIRYANLIFTIFTVIFFTISKRCLPCDYDDQTLTFFSINDYTFRLTIEKPYNYFLIQN